MKHRREILMTLTASLVAAGVIIMPVLAAEPFGVITHVALANKKMTFLTKGNEKLELEITENTEIVTSKGNKINLEAVANGVAKAIEEGKKGVFARVSHEKGVTSKISVGLPKEPTAK